jgi:hypothetical protein
MTTRQYARLVSEWIASIGLDPLKFGTHRAAHLRGFVQVGICGVPMAQRGR